MAGWTCPDSNDMLWDGRLIAKNFRGDGSELTNLSAGTETDPTFQAASAAMISNIAANTAKVSYTDAVQYQSTSGAYIAHAADNTIHYVDPGFLTAETDPTFQAASAAMISDIAANTGKISYTDAAQFQVASAAVIVNTAKVSYTDAAQFQVASAAIIVNSAKVSYTDAAQYQVTSGAIVAHLADSTDPHGATLTQTNINSSGTANASAAIVSGDRTASGAAYISNIVYSEGSSPTASNYPIGSVLVVYTP